MKKLGDCVPFERKKDCPRTRTYPGGLRTGLTWVLLLWLAHGSIPNLLAQNESSPQPDQPFRSDRILVQMRPGVRKFSMPPMAGQRVLRYYPAFDLKLVELPPGVQVLDAVEAYRANASVVFAEPDYFVEGARTPNDPHYVNGLLWGLHNSGQSGGVPDADLDAPEGWAGLSSASNVVVAVIDTGIRFTHEDLAANMWRNPGEIPGNRIDDDRNGIIDDVHGINAITHSGHVHDDNGHGTHVAGTIGAVGNNGKGGTGVAWNVRLMACKFLDSNNRGSISDAIECVNYATSHGAQIINASWTAARNSSALQSAINTAKNMGVLFVTAAGNTGDNLDRTPVYPACYNLDNIVVVTGLTRKDAIDTAYANYGATTVDIGAAGSSIYSAWHTADSAYHYLTGTSMAAPYVSGVLALMKARYPNDTYKQLISRLLLTTDRVSSLAGKTVSGGRVNLRKALGMPEFPSPPPPPKPSVVQLLPGTERGLLQIRVQGEPNRLHILQASSDFKNWISVSTNRAAADGIVNFTDQPANSRRFYRAISAP